MIWIQTALHSTDITERNLEKNNNKKLILKKKYQQTTKPWQIIS